MKQTLKETVKNWLSEDQVWIVYNNYLIGKDTKIEDLVKK